MKHRATCIAPCMKQANDNTKYFNPTSTVASTLTQTRHTKLTEENNTKANIWQFVCLFCCFFFAPVLTLITIADEPLQVICMRDLSFDTRVTETLNNVHKSIVNKCFDYYSEAQ